MKVFIVKIFISYATSDQAIFRILEVVHYLEIQKVGHVFYWERDTELGQSFDEYMERGIQNCDIIIVFCSKTSKVSGPVQTEMQLAIKYMKKVVPIFKELIDIFLSLSGIEVCNSTKQNLMYFVMTYISN